MVASEMLFQILFQLLPTDPAKLTELITCNKLVFLFAQVFLYGPYDALCITQTPARDPLNIFWINDKPIAFHGSVFYQND